MNIKGEKMKKKRFISLMLIFVMAINMLAVCGNSKDKTENEDQEDKISISMYMWDRSLFKELTPWLEQRFPYIEFTFVQSYNTIDYYKDLIDRGEPMPDIITCHRFI